VGAGGHRCIAFHPAAIAEQRHHPVQAELLVEVGAADMHAACREDVRLPVVHRTALRRQAHQREVGGTAADIHDQLLRQAWTLDDASPTALQTRISSDRKMYNALIAKKKLQLE